MPVFQPPAPPAPPSAGDVKVQVGPSGVQILKPGDDAAISQLQAQARVLKARIDALRSEIDAVKAEIAAPGSAPLLATNQLRLTGLEGRRIDAEESLQRIEDQLAGIGVSPATTTEVGTPAAFEPVIPFDPNQSALQERIAMIAVAAIVCIGMPIAVAFARLIWKRTTSRTTPLPEPRDAQRLERVEQAVDAIALEVERMSEGQRYVTKLLSERAELAASNAVAQTDREPLRR